MTEQEKVVKNILDNVLRTAPEKQGLKLDENSVDLLHAGLGLVTEVGELNDIIKKFLFYGKEIDVINLLEEVGDIMWYIFFLSARVGINLDECIAMNLEKLKKRFPEKFTEEKANNRDLDSERETLESNAVSVSEKNTQNNEQINKNN